MAMDDLIEKIEELHKGLLSLKQPAKQDAFVPAIKPPTLKAPSLKVKVKSTASKVLPGALPPPSKKDPIKVAQQLKNPRPGKVQVDILKVEDNGQWSLSKGDAATKISGTPSPARATKLQIARAPVDKTEGFANHHNPEQNKLIHGLDIHNTTPLRGGLAGGGAHSARNPITGESVVLKRASSHSNQQERGHLDNGFNSAKREVLFHNMARDYFGMGRHVPTTAGFSRHGEDYSAQKELKNAKHADLDKHPEQGRVLNNLHQSGDLHKLGIMDHLMGHHDRHRGNYMMDDKNLHLIDNGTAFDYKNFDQHHYPGYLERAEGGMGLDNSQVHPAAAKWLNKLEPEKAKQFLAAHGHEENSPTTQGFLRRLQGMKNAVNNGPEHYKYMDTLFDKNRLTSGPLYQHPDEQLSEQDQTWGK